MDIRNWFVSDKIENKTVMATKIINKTKIVDKTKNQIIEIYTDGSCFNNGRKNNYGGIGIYIPKLDIKFSKKIPNATNNISELKAILKATKFTYSKKFPNTNFVLYTDSQYSINCCTKWHKKWRWNGREKKYYKYKNRAVKNSQLIRRIVKILTKKNNIQLKFIRAHTNNSDSHSMGNSIADLLAKKALSN